MDQDARRERLSSAAMLLEHTVLSSGLSSGAATPTEVRRAAFDAAPAEGALAAYVTGVEIHPELVTAAMVEDLRQTGMSQDALFDVTVAAALGAARRRLQAGMELIARPEP